MNERKPLEFYLRRTGQTKRPLTDTYAFLLRARWPVVIGLAALVFLAMNVGFALLYELGPGSVANSDGSFSDSFFFSVQTFAAIGYGFMSADGVWGNSVVVLEAFSSLLCIAVLTGIVFGKFARPHARVLFSEVAVVERRDGVPTLSFRVANERGNDVVEASIRVSALKTIINDEGSRLRRFYDLELERKSTPVFLLSWQVFHKIDETSPLFGMTPEQMRDEDVRLTIALTGLDGTFAQTIHARHMYWAEDLRFGHRFVDVMRDLEGGVVEMDFAKFHLTAPQDEARSAAG